MDLLLVCLFVHAPVKEDKSHSNLAITIQSTMLGDMGVLASGRWRHATVESL